MIRLHVISDNSYFLMGISHSPYHQWFSSVQITNTGATINDELVERISDAYDHITVVNVACGNMRRELLNMLGRLGKKVLVMAHFKISQTYPLLPLIICKKVTAEALLRQAFKLVTYKIDPATLSLVNSPDYPVIFLMGRGVKIKMISSIMNLCEKKIYVSANRLVEKTGLRGKDKINIMLCCDLLRMFKAYSKYNNRRVLMV